jgi:hypothetical protein
MNIHHLNISTTIAIGLIVAFTSNATMAERINADVWADNWFALYVDEKLIAEDSVPFNTEQSFNAESFSFDTALPAQVSVIARDFIENDTGLEYIGSRRQQMGDGGFKAQFIDAETGKTLAVSNDSWHCKAVHRAPLNSSCERSPDPEQSCQSDIEPEPENWKRADFDSNAWPNAVIHTERAVRPHGGYSRIQWHPTAKLIWTEDLEIDNTLLCRFTLTDSE